MANNKYRQREDKLTDIMCDLLYLLGCGVNEKMPSDAFIKTFQENYHGEKMEDLYKMGHGHFVDALAGTVLKRAGIKLIPIWEQSIGKAIRKTILFDQERAKIFSYMDQQGIWYMPLKGVVLKDYYPSVGMRQMSDNDILFDKSYAKDICDYMVSCGYFVESFGEANHDVYQKAPVYNFEMHTSLYGAGHNEKWVKYYDTVKERLIKDEKGFGYHFSEEDFYVYIVSHTFRHFEGSGTGIRSLLDLYVYLNKSGDTLDFDYIDKQCEILEISAFEKENRVLCKKVFQMNDSLVEAGAGGFRDALSADENRMLYYYMTSGAYGFAERRITNCLNDYRKKYGSVSKVVYVANRLFPGKEHYSHFPILEKYPWLIPFYLVYRIFCMLFSKERRNRIQNEINIVKKAD